MACMWAGVHALALNWQRNLLSILTHPADLLGRHAHHECVGFDVLVNHSPGTYKRVFANGGATHNGAVSTQCGTFFDQGVAVFTFALNKRPRVIHIGKDHAGAAKHAVFQRDVVIHADVVLNFAVVANDDLVAHKYVLP